MSAKYGVSSNSESEDISAATVKHYEELLHSSENCAKLRRSDKERPRSCVGESGVTPHFKLGEDVNTVAKKRYFFFTI